MEKNDQQSQYSGFLDGMEPQASAAVLPAEERILSVTATSMLREVIVGGRRRVYKSLAPANRNLQSYRRLLRKEYDILSRLSHPGVVMAFGLTESPDCGEEIEMEWIDGMTLERRLADNPDREERRRVAMQILDAVEYIHSKGIVHRDLKPGNIMVTHDGAYIKLIDFGLADTRAHTELKNPAGTEGYMSNHQREAFECQIADDIFALQKVFSELLREDAAWLSRRKVAGDVGELRRLLQQHWQRPERLKRVFWFGTTVVAVAATVWIVADRMQSRQQSRLEAQAAELNRQIAVADSVHREVVGQLHDSIEAVSSRFEATTIETERLGDVVSSQQRNIDDANRRKALVANVINRMSQRLVAEWHKADAESDEPTSYYRVENGYRLIREYVNSNPDNLTAGELGSIETALTAKLRELNEEWKRKNQ